MKRRIILVGSNFTKNNINRDGDCLRLTNIYSNLLLLGIEVNFISIDNYCLDFNNEPNIYRFRSFMKVGPRSISLNALKTIKQMLKDEKNIIILKVFILLFFLSFCKKFKNRIYISLVNFSTYAVLKCLFSKISIINFLRQSLVY